MISNYERDFYTWCVEQANYLKTNNFEGLDKKNLIEKLESLGRRERSELVDRLTILMAHLLKWDFQPSYRSKSWEHAIAEQTERVKDLLKENPSLKSECDECCKKAYRYALRQAALETGMDLETFSEAMPFSFRNGFPLD